MPLLLLLRNATPENIWCTGGACAGSATAAAAPLEASETFYFIATLFFWVFSIFGKEKRASGESSKVKRSFCKSHEFEPFHPFHLSIAMGIIPMCTIPTILAHPHTHPHRQPDSGHFGTPFSHKHFNEKYQRNCFRNCFICHKQNACQIFFMPAMAATGRPSAPSKRQSCYFSLCLPPTISFLPLPLSLFLPLLLKARFKVFSLQNAATIFALTSPSVYLSLSCSLSLFALLCCIFSFWYFN